MTMKMKVLFSKILFCSFMAILSINGYSQCNAITSLTDLSSGSRFKFKIQKTNQAIRVRSDNKLEQSTSDNNNVFQLVDVGSGYFKIINEANNHVLEIKSGSESPGSFLVQTATYNGSDHQKFKFQLIGSSFKLISKHVESFGFGVVMETYSGSGEYGLIRQYGYSNSNSPSNAELFNLCKLNTSCSAPTPASLSAFPSTIDGTSGSSSLSATCSSGSLRWYDVASGGTAVGTGSPWTTPVLTGTKSFYAACFTNECEGARTTVSITVNPPSSEDLVTSLSSLSSGSKFKFKVQKTNQAIRVRSDNKLEQSTADNNNLFQLVDVGNGYFKIINEANNHVLEIKGGSESPGSFLVQTANYNGSDQQKFKFQLIGSSFKLIPKHVETFGFGVVMETYSGSGEYGLIRQYGYSNSSGPNNSELFKIYKSGTGPVIGCTSPTPTSSSASPSTINGTSGTSSLSASCSSGSLRWYDVVSGGAAIGTGSPWTTPVLTGTKSFYATCFANDCEGARTAVAVTLDSGSSGGVGGETVFSSDADTYYLSNGVVKVGFSRVMGGSISHMMRITNGVVGENLIDNNDAGRQAGLDPYLSLFQNNQMLDSNSRINWLNNAYHSNDVWNVPRNAPSTNGYAWNALPQGNFYNKYFNLNDTGAYPSNLGGDPASNGGILSFNNSTGELYIKTKLYLWNFVSSTPSPYSKIEAGAWNEYWVKLEDKAIKVKITQTRDINLNTIPNVVWGTEAVGFHAFASLAPAPSGHVKYNFLATYDGTSPWTNGSVLKDDIDNYKRNHGGSGAWDIAYQAGVRSYNCAKRKNWENWAAVVDNSDFGLGIYTEDTRFTDFTFSIESSSNSASSFSINGKFFCQNDNCKQGTDTFEYAYIVGNLSEIREYAYRRKFTPSCGQ